MDGTLIFSRSKKKMTVFSGSHGGEYEYERLLGYCAVKSLGVDGISEVVTASVVRASALMMEAVRTSETSVYFYETTRRNIPEGCDLQ
jgi:hypothetical protein